MLLPVPPVRAQPTQLAKVVLQVTTCFWEYAIHLVQRLILTMLLFAPLVNLRVLHVQQVMILALLASMLTF